MQPQTSQDPVKQANEARASMGIATRLNDALLQHQAPPMAPQTPQNAPGQETGEKVDTETSKDEDSEKGDLTKTLTDFKTEIEGMLDSKLGDIKRELETIMAEEKDEQETKTPTTA